MNHQPGPSIKKVRRISKSLLLFFPFFLIFSALSAQEKFTLSGVLTARETGEKLIGASISIPGSPFGASSNEYGYYSLSLPEGKYSIHFSAVGFTEIAVEVLLDKNRNLDISFLENEKSMEQVVISARSSARSLRSPQMGMERITTREIRNIPLLLGERDVLKAIQLLPGIKSAGDGASGFYVRGGAADQNLILLDGAPVYNASHLLGFFSTFNSDAIKDVTIYKGGMPAQYGGRLSSVLDIKMNDGNNRQLTASGGIGIISSRLNIEGPIQKDRSSFLVAGRRTYADLFLKLSKDSTINRNRLYFYDLNMKLNFHLGKKDQLFLSGYFGHDVMGLRDLFGLKWGNGTGTIRWNHVYSPKLFSNTSLLFSNYDYQISTKTESDDFTIFSQIRDWNLKQDFQWYLDPRNTIVFGLNSIYHTIRPGEVTASKLSGIGDAQLQKRFAWENAAFISNNWKTFNKLTISYGLRLTSFSALGEGDFYTIDKNGKVSDTISYNKGEFVKTYFNPEPRVSASYQLNSISSVKASYVRNVQNLHLLSNSTTMSPTDKWIASSNVIRPEISDQYSIGYYKDLADRKYELTVEAYYKNMQNQIDYRSGANIYTNDAVESQLLFGKGRAYGIEAHLKKRKGNLTGWISYTLSKTERKIEGINENKWYNARQDRTHDLAIVGSYQINKKWTVSANWVYYTGDAVTFPSGKYIIDDQVVFYYTERNGYRMPSYHRLDLGASLQLKKKGRYSSELNFSLYNAYGRENAYSIAFRKSTKDPEKTEAVQTTLFRLIPSISYNFKF